MKLWTALTLVACLAASAGGRTLAGDVGRSPVRSLLEMRTAGVVMQQWDNSCGAAVLTTVLKYEFGEPLTERAVALAMLSAGNPDQIRRQGGFSFLDLKRFAATRGYRAVGYQNLQLDNLKRWRFSIVPVIEYGRVPHFIVVRLVRANGDLDVADPAFGNRVLSPRQFQAIWRSHVALIVEKRDAA